MSLLTVKSRFYGLGFVTIIGDRESYVIIPIFRTIDYDDYRDRESFIIIPIFRTIDYDDSRG